MKKIYAELSYGRAALAILEVEERPNSYKVISHKSVVGFYYGKTFKKDDQIIHDNFADAFLYLEKQAKMYLEAREFDYNNALSTYNELSDVVKKIQSDPLAPEKAIKELMPELKL